MDSSDKFDVGKPKGILKKRPSDDSTTKHP